MTTSPISPVTFVQPLHIRSNRVHIAHSAAICSASLPARSLHNDSNKGAGESESANVAKRAQAPKNGRRARLPAAVVAAAGALLSTVFANRVDFVPWRPLPVHASSTKPSTQSAQTKKQLRYDGRQELDSKEKAMSLTLTAGTFAALGVWAWKQNRRDDELETIRIKEEVDRLEKLQAEFVDVEEDDESLDDEDLLASLKQRISEGEDEDDGLDGGSPPTETDVTDSQDSPVDGDGEETDAADADASPDSVDMLRRMWDATDEDKKA